MFGLLLAGAIALLILLPLIPELELPASTSWGVSGVSISIVVYALTLLPTKLVVSDEGLWQKQLGSELRLHWKDIEEWRYVRVQDVEYFWIRDRAGNQHQLKSWLVFGKERSQRLAQILRQNGVLGTEEFDS